MPLDCRNAPSASDFILQLLKHIATVPGDRRLEPLVLRCLERMQWVDWHAVKDCRVVFGEEGAAQVSDQAGAPRPSGHTRN